MIDQGTILDRIDFNIQDAKQKVEKANIHIESTLKYEQKGRSRCVLLFLVNAILLCILILIIKWSVVF